MTVKPKFGIEPNVTELVIHATELLNDEMFPFAESASVTVQEVEIKGIKYELILTLKAKNDANTDSLTV